MKENIMSTNRSISISGNQVHIWQSNLLNPESAVDRLYHEVLSDDERVKSDRLRSLIDRGKFIGARAGLRIILSKYLDLRPEEIVFCYTEHGKPLIDSKHNTSSINFNLSHSNNHALYAIAQNRRVGVDIEHMRQIRKADRIIQKHFSPQEADYYHTHPANKKQEAFFKLWTRKEAYTKAKGIGIRMPRNQIELSLVPTETDTELGWRINELKVETGYVAALVVEGKEYQVINMRLSALT